jgi:putative membrane protein
MDVKKFLTEEDLKKISAAVMAAELKTGGEIVPMVAADSDDYPEVPWRCGFILVSLLWMTLTVLSLAGVNLTPAALFRLWDTGDNPLTGSPVVFVTLLSALVYLAGFFLSFLSPVRRLFVTRKRSAGEVRQAAMEAFLDSNVHVTKGHTGILIYLSLFERRVEIIADQGIHKALPDPDVWNEITAELVASIRAKKQAEGLIRAVERCGALLSGAVPREADDTNELSDGVRFRDGK